MEVLCLGIAYVLGLIATAVRLPTLVGYLGAGFALSSLGIEHLMVEGSEVIQHIGHYGVLFLLFTVGLHLRLKNILQPEVLGVGGIHLLLSAALFTGVALALGLTPQTALLIAVGLGFSSTVLTAKSFEARGELDAYHSRIALGILILQDLVAVALLAVAGDTTPSPWAVTLLALPLLRPLLGRALLASGREELMVIYGLLLAIGGGGLFTYLGLSSELGALVAGALLAGHERADELSDKLWSLKEVFLVGFFLWVGLTGLPSLEGFWTALLLLALLPIKSVLFFFLLVAFRLRARTAFVTALALSSYSEFVLIIGAAAAAAGLVPGSLVIVLALVTALSYALSAPLSRAVDRIWTRYDEVLIRFERSGKHPDHLPPPSLGSARYLVIGMGRAGAAAYDHLKAAGERVVAIDSDPARISQSCSAGRRVIFGDAQDPELWSSLKLDRLAGIILAISNPRAKVAATRALRENGFTGPINALTMHEEEHRALLEAGASAICLPLTQAGRQLAEASLKPPEERSMTLEVVATTP